MQTGTLYIVATPIGNLNDITLRALNTLKAVDIIAAEDTRHSSKLLKNFEINKPLFALHDFNEANKAQALINKLQQGKNIALISDAGTPLISDPGYKLVRLVKDANITVTPIPGPCAAIAALSAAGLPTDKFIFEGFLPVKTTAQKARLEELKTETRTLIFYEAPHRLLNTLKNIKAIFGAERVAVLAKELTKTFETIYSAEITEIITWLEAEPARQKGEFVLLIHGANPKPNNDIDPETLRILQILRTELPNKQAAVLTARITGISKNKLYDIGHKN